MTSEALHRAAAKLGGCSKCEKRRAAMNAVVPGSGDAVKAVTSTVARGLQGAARLIDPAKPRVWTAPLEIPEGWELVEECGVTALYRNGQKYIVWDRIDGQYRNSHTVCCGAPEIARKEFDKRCRS